MLVDTIPFDGKEMWVVYTLGDGTEIKLKLFLREVYKIVGQTSPAGDPSYILVHDAISHVNAPNVLETKSTQVN